MWSKCMKGKYQPVIIIGAPRSGTNMLRDVLTRLKKVSTWPCDEINYIWRHGNVFYPSDEFPPELATDNVSYYVRKKFDWVAKKYGAEFVVEKTCANSLRVEFVDRILPDAKYIFIKRNPYDAVASAMKRWTAKLDIKYILKKARFVPLTDLPYYGSKYLWNRIYRLFSKEKRLAFWGPKLNNMESLLKQYSLEEICALQWKKCVNRANEAFQQINKSRVFKIDYEIFVQEPEEYLKQICNFLELDYKKSDIRNAVYDVKVNSVGKGRKQLRKDQIDKISSVINS